MTFYPPPFLIGTALLVLVLTAGAYDIRFRRIPNWLSVSGVALGAGLNLLLSGASGISFALKGLGLGFGFYLLLYLLHAMGAGDVKLMAAIGALAGWRGWLGIFFFSAIVGGIVGLIAVILRKRVKATFWNIGYILGQLKRGRAAYLTRDELDVRSPQSMGLPHAAVIAVGTVFFLAVAAHFVK